MNSFEPLIDFRFSDAIRTGVAVAFETGRSPLSIDQPEAALYLSALCSCMHKKAKTAPFRARLLAGQWSWACAVKDGEFTASDPSPSRHAAKWAPAKSRKPRRPWIVVCRKPCKSCGTIIEFGSRDIGPGGLGYSSVQCPDCGTWNKPPFLPGLLIIPVSLIFNGWWIHGVFQHIDAIQSAPLSAPGYFSTFFFCLMLLLVAHAVVSGLFFLALGALRR
jgi:hypothetical protein